MAASAKKRSDTINQAVLPPKQKRADGHRTRGQDDARAGVADALGSDRAGLNAFDARSGREEGRGTGREGCGAYGKGRGQGGEDAAAGYQGDPKRARRTTRPLTVSAF